MEVNDLNEFKQRLAVVPVLKSGDADVADVGDVMLFPEAT